MRPPKERFPFAWIAFFVSIFLLPSCATTKVTEVWRDENYRGTIGKVAVIGIFKEPDTRKIFEDEFVDRLKARGVDAVASHKIVSEAERSDKAVVLRNIRKIGADTVLVTRVVDMETETTYVSGQGYLVPTYYGYYGTYYGYVYEPGRSVQEGAAFTETNLYGLDNEKLIWSSRAKTNFSATRYELIQAFVKTMIDRLSADKLIRQ